MGLAALLLLADGRLPAGGHVHSGGAETACARGLVHDRDSLAIFLTGRLHTAGLLTAAAAATAWLAAADLAPVALAVALARLDTELDARTPSPALRAASRSQGHSLLRVAATAWPSPNYASLGGAHHGVVLGVVGQAAGCTATQAATVAALHSVSTPATAALRLLGLDPYEVTGVQAALGPAVDRVSRRAVAAALRDELPGGGAPNLDLLAEQHAAAPAPLFAS